MSKHNLATIALTALSFLPACTTVPVQQPYNPLVNPPARYELREEDNSRIRSVNKNVLFSELEQAIATQSYQTARKAAAKLAYTFTLPSGQPVLPSERENRKRLENLAAAIPEDEQPIALLVINHPAEHKYVHAANKAYGNLRIEGEPADIGSFTPDYFLNKFMEDVASRKIPTSAFGSEAENTEEKYCFELLKQLKVSERKIGRLVIKTWSTISDLKDKATPYDWKLYKELCEGEFPLVRKYGHECKMSK
ncbi:MAG TPA: hypothetical protein VJJ82_05025 [Candidatus Nanoarchaeia archaeon]|nr:hypothetical protein [Candidatus Nanoarchaeia archaeon]